MNETNVKTVKKIKKVVVTEDTRYQTFGIDTEFKSDKQFHKSENKEYSKIVNLECADSKSNDVAVKKVKKVVKSVEPTHYVHTCGYDYVVDTIDADVAFSGTKDECDDWMKEHSIVEGLEDNTNSSEIISFTRVTDLDPNKYKDFFTKERFPKGAIFFDWEVLPYFWCVTFYDVMNYKKTVIVNDRKSLLKFYAKTKDELYFGYNNRNYDNLIYKGILLGMNPKEINDKIVYDGLKGF